LLLVLVCLGVSQDSPRLKSLSSKMKCDCGCGEVLGECSHKECTRKPQLQRELSDDIATGKTDDATLQAIATAHGTDILLTPTFQGFNTMLWIVPITIGMFAVGATIAVQRRRTASAKKP
jgi:cytochrome c-type biogenesis protein CcmH/NrfF